MNQTIQDRDSSSTLQAPSANTAHTLPAKRDLYYAGAWHKAAGGYVETLNPGTGEALGACAEANKQDIDAAVAAAKAAFIGWSKTKPSERAHLLKQVAMILRANVDELSMLDAINCGNPISEMKSDVIKAAENVDFFAGLVTEMKGETVPMGEGVVNLSVREPVGVVGRIVAYNHPLMFTAAKIAAPLAAGNVVIIKPPQQAPLSAYRLFELIEGIFPPGVVNLVTGAAECGSALVAHPDVPYVSLIGSVATGRAIAKAGAERLKHVSLELGGKNPCIVYPDADVDRAIKGAIAGMNFTWCGQSCGSTSRLFVHESIHDQVVAGILKILPHYKPGIPTRAETTMGAIVSKVQQEKILSYIDIAIKGGATLAYGGKVPTDPELKNGFFVEPTLFTDVTQDMRIANEEVFGPVLSVIKWSDEESMLEQVNRVEYGLTAAIFTRDIGKAHSAASRVQAGYVWVNHAGPHYIGTGYGGYKQSGIGREESIEELLTFTQSKNINIRW